MSYATELHANVMAGHMVTRRMNGTSYALWRQGDEFVMSKQYGSANPRHQLCTDETSPERLAAHWNGFCRQGEVSA